MTTQRVLALLELGTYINTQSFLQDMPEPLVQKFRQDLSHLDGREVAMLSFSDKHLVHSALGLHNKEIVRQCTEYQDVNPDWSDTLKDLVKRKRTAGSGVRVHLSGHNLSMFLARMALGTTMESTI